MTPRPNRDSTPKTPAPPQRRPAKRTPARAPARAAARVGRSQSRRGRQSRTLMKVTSGDGKGDWVTVQVPAWIAALIAIVVVVGAVAILSSPELAARLSLALYQLSQGLREKRTP